ncbi:hypothetical protein O181_008288 [Austropuccinia psidii MF-1]|uniref:Retrovirus-related Pol polyprotein from transposon TNT 1-94-like beta-barrel domain-containing protein n=1 Tax=Austropuccinia psidii MF-1 TaxID=1389203 RepID=A0A9Q3BNT9_9BASI|nr:hypothetical protein [Austropuccinia psidii MF-1]
MALTIKNIDIFIKPNWISSLPNDTLEEEVEFLQNSCRHIYFWLANTLDQENYNPAALWLNIRDFYAASSVENCTTVITKLFGIKIEDGIISNSIIEIWHQSKLLKSMGQDLFEEKTMNQELSLPDGQALHIGERRVKCKNGKHSPEAPHSEDQGFQLHPHLLKEFRERRNQDKHSKVTSSASKSTSLKPISSTRIFCIGTESKRVSFIKEECAILDSGASHSLFKDSERFVSFTKTRVALNQANGSVIYAECFGTAAITGYKYSIIHLKNSLIVPRITTPLISLSPFLQRGCSLSGKGESIQLFDEDN